MSPCVKVIKENKQQNNNLPSQRISHGNVTYRRKKLCFKYLKNFKNELQNMRKGHYYPKMSSIIEK